jgi:hypothetical protein
MLKQISLITTACLTLALATTSTIYTSKSFAQTIPKAQCISAYGQTKCGYSCVEAYGEIKCADWPGGACKEAYGEITCGPKAPSNWLYLYKNESSSANSNLGVRGTWAVTIGRWNGILRMNGIVGNLVLVSNKAGIAEQRMVLKQSSDGGYVLDGEVITLHNFRGKYHADHIYIQKFSKSFSARNCDENQPCSDATFTWLSDRSQL